MAEEKDNAFEEWWNKLTLMEKIAFCILALFGAIVICYLLVIAIYYFAVGLGFGAGAEIGGQVAGGFIGSEMFKSMGEMVSGFVSTITGN